MKKNLVFITLSILLLASCDSNSTKEEELSLKKDNSKQQESKPVVTSKEEKSAIVENNQIEKRRKLRYLYFSNGGLIGYFDDGTVSACPRCDLIKENVKALYNEKPFKTYTIENDFLLIDGNEREYPKQDEGNVTEGWAMIDYKWVVDL